MPTPFRSDLQAFLSEFTEQIAARHIAERQVEEMTGVTLRKKR